MSEKWAGIRNFVTYYSTEEPTSPSPGDVWYDPLYRVYRAWDGVKWVKADQPDGTLVAPLVTVSPATVTLPSSGDTATLDVTVVNQDHGFDAPATFKLEVDNSDPASVQVELSADTVTVNPGSSATVDLTVTALTGGPVNATFTVRARATGHPVGVSSPVSVAVGSLTDCVEVGVAFVPRLDGTVTFTQTNQTVSVPVEVYNLDAGTCSDRTIDVTVESGDSTLVVASVTPTAVTLGPGESTVVTVTLTKTSESFPGGDVAVPVTVGGAATFLTLCTGRAVWAPGADYGYASGGGDSDQAYSLVERFNFAFDTAPSRVGQMTYEAVRLSGNNFNSSTAGFINGGYDAFVDYVGYSYRNRFEFPFDDGTVAVEGYWSREMCNPIQCNSSEAGFVGGSDACAGSASYYSAIERYHFALDVGEVVGALTQDPGSAWCAGVNASFYGFFPYGDSEDFIMHIDRIEFPFSGGTTSRVASHDAQRYSQAGANSTRCGYLMGGSGRTSVITRFEFPLDTGIVVAVGTLQEAIQGNGGCNSTTCGFAVCGNWSDGVTAFIQRSDIERITFPFDSGTATIVASVTVARSGPLATNDGVDHAAVFVPQP